MTTRNTPNQPRHILASDFGARTPIALHEAQWATSGHLLGV